jgi:hypothetical protein
MATLALDSASRIDVTAGRMNWKPIAVFAGMAAFSVLASIAFLVAAVVVH